MVVRRKKTVIVLATLVAVFLLHLAFELTIGYYLKKSDAFNVAHAFIEDSALLRTLVGKIKKVDISEKGESFVTNGDLGGNSVLTLDIVGDIGRGFSQVRLEKKMGQWEVATAFFLTSDGTAHNIPTQAQAQAQAQASAQASGSGLAK